MNVVHPPLPTDPLVEEVDRFDRAHRLERRAAELDRAPAFPVEIYRAMGAAGLLGLTVPVSLGGRGVPTARAAVALFHLAYRSGTTFAKLSLQPEFSSVLGEHGAPDLVEAWYRPMLRGERLVANHVTEPGAGADVGRLTARAERTGNGYRLTGVKSEAAFAVDAEAAIVYARTGPESGTAGLTAFLVDQRSPGVHREVSPVDLGERWMRRGVVRYDGVEVPAAHRLGDEGAGFRLVRRELVRERGLLAAIYLGVAWAAWDRTVDDVARREAFGGPLANHEDVAFRLVDDYAGLRASWLLTRDALEAFDRGERADALTALAKTEATRVALRTLDDAVQFHGGRGYSSELPFERWWRDVRSGSIAHGPSEVLRLIVARSIWKG